MKHDRRDQRATAEPCPRATPSSLRLLGAGLAVMVLWSFAAGQGLTGRFAGDADIGRMELTLERTTAGLAGVLEAPGIRVSLEGDVDDGVGFGYAFVDDEVLGFEAYVEGDVVGLYLFEFDALGNALVDTAVELILTRVAPAARPAPDASTSGTVPPGTPVPGSVAPGSAAPGSAAPAPPAPFAAPPARAVAIDGVYADDRITLDVRSGPDGYVGEVGSADQRYVLEAVATPGGMRGTFTGNGFTYDFVATVDGDSMRFETGGSVYHLARQGTAAGAAILDPARSAIIARGSAAELRLDDALAFIEALEFVLEQVGYAYRFSETERTDALRTFAQTFPTMSQQDQLVLAQARLIWERVRVQWPHADERERREFALGVLVLAFGEETVATWVGPQGTAGQGGAMGGGSRCATFDECTSAFVDEQTWTDTFNAQGCWAAAGCESYDVGTGTFTYSDDW